VEAPGADDAQTEAACRGRVSLAPALPLPPLAPGVEKVARLSIDEQRIFEIATFCSLGAMLLQQT